MAEKKNLNTVVNRDTIPSSGGLVTITTGTGGETEYINKGQLASQISGQLNLGDVVTKNVGIRNGDVLESAGIEGEGVLVYGAGTGIVTEPKQSAFNKNFGTANTNVARGDHTHNGLRNNIMYSYTTILNTKLEETIPIPASALLAVSPIGTTHINPAVIVSVYKLSGTGATFIDINDSQIAIARDVSTVASGIAHSLNTIQIKSLEESTDYMVCVSFSVGRIVVADTPIT